MENSTQTPETMPHAVYEEDAFEFDVCFDAFPELSWSAPQQLYYPLQATYSENENLCYVPPSYGSMDIEPSYMMSKYSRHHVEAVPESISQDPAIKAVMKWRNSDSSSERNRAEQYHTEPSNASNYHQFFFEDKIDVVDEMSSWDLLEDDASSDEESDTEEFHWSDGEEDNNMLEASLPTQYSELSMEYQDLLPSDRLLEKDSRLQDTTLETCNDSCKRLKTGSLNDLKQSVLEMSTLSCGYHVEEVLSESKKRQSFSLSTGISQPVDEDILIAAKKIDSIVVTETPCDDEVEQEKNLSCLICSTTKDIRGCAKSVLSPQIFVYGPEDSSKPSLNWSTATLVSPVSTVVEIAI